jgi:DNA polymerase III subunit chi
MNKHPNIIFIPVSNNQNKIGCICNTIQRHFNQGESILIAVPNEQAEKYLDDLLWKFPGDSFLPHAVSQNDNNERVLITKQAQNLNKSKILFNLCPAASPIADQFEIIYELYDETFPDKLEQSKNRRHAYSELGYAMTEQH